VDEQDLKEATRSETPFLKDRHNSVTITPSDVKPTGEEVDEKLSE